MSKSDRDAALAELIGRPEKTAGNGRTVTGQFAPGNSGGPGRPPGYDFRTILRDAMAKEGKSAEDMVAEITRSLRLSASLGDTAAAKLLLDRTCGKEADAVDMNVNDLRQLSDVERAARLASILEAAKRRNGHDA